MAGDTSPLGRRATKWRWGTPSVLLCSPAPQWGATSLSLIIFGSSPKGVTLII